MAFYQLHKEILLKGSLDEVWNFISSPENLKKITPDYLGFDIETKNLPKEIYPGLVIQYKVSPILGIKMTWVSEITQMRQKAFFVDRQLIGPYKLWHHQHILKETNDGILMTDIVSYQPPYAFLASIVNRLFIQKKLHEIFAHRSAVMLNIFK